MELVPGETEIHQDGRVTVTSHRIVGDGVMYEVKSIGSVRVGHPTPGPGVVGCLTTLIATAGLFGLATYVMADSGCQGESTINQGKMIVAAILALGIFIFLAAKHKINVTYVVFISMGGTEKGILTGSDSEWAHRVANAIQNAIMSRKD